jgi:hypothetical protein
MIMYDRKTRCYTDGRNYVHASTVRDYAVKKLGIKSQRGKLSRESIAAYFLDVFQVSDEVA